LKTVSILIIETVAITKKNKYFTNYFLPLYQKNSPVVKTGGYLQETSAGFCLIAGHFLSQ
jgi:hypothetical protein